MRWLRSTPSRVMLYLAVALAVGAAVGSVFGVKLSSSYSAALPSSEIGAGVVVVMPTSSSGEAEVVISGASDVVYLSLGTNPIELLPQLHGLGLSIVTSQGKTDLRAGVVIQVVGLQGNPILVEEAFENVVKTAAQHNGTYIVDSEVSPSQYLIVVAVPANNTRAVSFQIYYRVTGYSRLSNEGAAIGAGALVVAAVIYDALSRSRL